MKTPRPCAFYVMQAKPDGTTVLRRIIQARTRAEAIRLLCRRS